MTNRTMLKTLAAAAVLALSGWAGAAQAASVSAACPDTGTWDRTFTLSSDDADVTSIDCYAWGGIPDPMDTGLADQLAADGYDYAGTVGMPSEGDITGFEDMADLLSGIGGSFDIAEAVDVVLIFKVGFTACLDPNPVPALRCLPSYAAFAVTTTEAALLSWSTNLDKGTLSHVSIYIKPAAVPLPAAGLLLLGGMGALGLARRRRG